jgi:YHS domain-containing protein
MLEPLPKAERVPSEEAALGGHCPVALVEGKTLMRGSPELQYRYQGVVYQLASPSAAAKFAQQPGVYVPPFSVFDPVAFSETRERTTGSLGVFTLYQGKPWFFLNTDNKNKFLLRPDPYVKTALAAGN